MTLNVRKSASIVYVVGLVLLVAFCAWQGAQYALAARETSRTNEVARGLKPIELPGPPKSVVAVPQQDVEGDDDAPKMTAEERELYATYLERMGEYDPFLDRAMFGKAEIIRVEGKTGPARPTRAPVVRPIRFTGVMGKFAILDNQLIRVGQRVSDAKLLAVLPNEVLLERNGETTSVSLFLALNSPNPLIGGQKTVSSSSTAAEAARRAASAKKMKDRAAFLREQEQRSRSQQYRDTQSRSPSSKYIPKKKR